MTGGLLQSSKHMASLFLCPPDKSPVRVSREFHNPRDVIISVTKRSLSISRFSFSCAETISDAVVRRVLTFVQHMHPNYFFKIRASYHLKSSELTNWRSFEFLNKNIFKGTLNIRFFLILVGHV